MDMRIVRDITNFIFLEDELERADVIFIPGGSYPQLPERAAALWREGYAPWVVPSGRYSVKRGKFGGVKSGAEKYPKEYMTECGFYTDVLLSNGVDADGIIPEEEAQYTAQNARFSKSLLDARGIRPQKAILCCKGYHSRRCLMYYQFSFPDTEFIIAPVYVNVTKENWFRTDKGVEKVLGELTRLGTQFVPEWEELKNGFTGTSKEDRRD
ncbi:MAG: YdcF family protein [Lachnospiraceae bacterium]|nr:YdcF family protein [Lachnospiraceae bacterium]